MFQIIPIASPLPPSGATDRVLGKRGEQLSSKRKGLSQLNQHSLTTDPAHYGHCLLWPPFSIKSKILKRMGIGAPDLVDRFPDKSPCFSLRYSTIFLSNELPPCAQMMKGAP